MEVKIKRYKIGKDGIRGVKITLPKWWIEDAGVGPGDYIHFYADEKGRLILVPEKFKRENPHELGEAV